MLYELIYIKFKNRQNGSMVIEIKTVFIPDVRSGGELHIVWERI